MASTRAEVENAWWVNGVAGGFGAALAKTLMTPPQRIVVLRQIRDAEMQSKSTLELIRHVAHENGSGAPLHQKLRPFFRGNLTSVLQRFPYSGIQLMIYDRCKHGITAVTGVEAKAAADASLGDHLRGLSTKALSGGLSATVSGAVCFPAEVVRTRLMSRDPRYTRIGPTARAVWAETGGPRNFYGGLSASLCQRVPDIMINFTVYESVKFSMQDRGFGMPACVVAGGSAAALTSVALTYPLDVAKRCMAMSGQGSAARYTGVAHCLRSIARDEGVRGLYRGASLEAARCMPQVVLMWFAIDYSRELLSSLSARK